MSTVTKRARTTDVLNGNWKAGVLGGVAGGLVMGALMIATSPDTIAVAIPSLYGLAPPPNTAVGLVVHVSHGATLGVVFGAVAGVLGVTSTGRMAGLGLTWGVITWVGLAALVMPVWLSVVGSPASPPFPNFAVPSLVWHAVYGLVLGGVYAVTEDAV
jgi:hypothetical protein